LSPTFTPTPEALLPLVVVTPPQRWNARRDRDSANDRTLTVL
jgi:hypothetical protein